MCAQNVFVLVCARRMSLFSSLQNYFLSQACLVGIVVPDLDEVCRWVKRKLGVEGASVGELLARPVSVNRKRRARQMRPEVKPGC